jgi:geranylgeranyl diphosphate synthase type I
MAEKTGNIKNVLESITRKVDPVIEEILTSSVDKKNHELIKYQISCGGKRLRPVLAILGCKMMGGKEEDVLYPAAALEILHNYTLIVDDIIDHSAFRRGKPTVWKKYGVTMAECISVSYAGAIFDINHKCKCSEDIYIILSKTLKMLTDGQILDILFEQKGREDEHFITKNRYSLVTMDDYYNMVSKKTATLLRACCEVGGICANSSDEDITHLKNFGTNLGMAFQVKDDTLDMFGNEKKFGKKIGKDIIERKLGNIIILLAMKEFDSKEKKEFIKILKRDLINDKDVQRGIDMISKTGAQEKALKLELEYLDTAKDSLDKLPQNEYGDDLLEITNYLVNRKS